MVKLIIDGREVNVPENTTILEAAASVGNQDSDPLLSEKSQ